MCHQCVPKKRSKEAVDRDSWAWEGQDAELLAGTQLLWLDTGPVGTRSMLCEGVESPRQTHLP